MAFAVRVEGIRFSAAHFATYNGQCEPMHGHSYEVAAEVEGALSQDSWVVDFSELKAVLRELVSRLDHRFILQAESRELTIERAEGAWKVRTPAGAAYLLPASDVVALPIDNSTAERLAEHLTTSVFSALAERGYAGVDKVSLEVWEGPEQRASYSYARLPLQ